MLVLSPAPALVRFLADGAALLSVTATSSGVTSGYQTAIIGLPDHVQTQWVTLPLTTVKFKVPR
jgi:hypothetical protein